MGQLSATLEREVTELRSTIKTSKASAAAKKATAEALVESEKAAGRNPIAGTTDDDKDSFLRIDAAFKESSRDAALASELEARLHSLLDHAGAEALASADGDATHPLLARARSIGAVAASSDEYKQFLASGQLGQPSGTVHFSPVEVLSKEETRRFLADAGDGTPLVPTDERLMPIMLPKRLPTVLDMISVRATSRDAVTWVRQTTRTNNAGTAAFGTALAKSRYLTERVTSPVIRKGHHAVADEGNLSDSDEFRGIIDDELVTDLRLKIETDVLSGGGGADWEGIYNTTGIGDFDGTGESIPDAFHKAITLVRVAFEKEPGAWGVSPTDFEQFYLDKGTDGHYKHTRGPSEGAPPSIWGLPAMISTAYTAPIVGDWQRGAVLWVREGISIAVDRIDDQFLEGLWTIRAQTRGAFAVRQPKAFATVSNLGAL